MKSLPVSMRLQGPVSKMTRRGARARVESDFRPTMTRFRMTIVAETALELKMNSELSHSQARLIYH